MSTDDHEVTAGLRLTPADVHSVLFSRAGLMNRGYDETEVDGFLARVQSEFARLMAEKAELRDLVRELQQRVTDGAAPQAPTTQAVRVLSAAQQTADQYVADAEDLSRVMTVEARRQYEDTLREARERADRIVQEAERTAASLAEQAGQEPEALQAQVVYLQAFGRACRTQLRSYLEALLTDVEAEWGRADPRSLPQQPLLDGQWHASAPTSENGAPPVATNRQL